MLRLAKWFSPAFLLLVAHTSYAQYPTTSDIATGLSPMAVYNVGDVDNVNPANGNLFLNIPLLSYPQLGKRLRLNFKIYYNDKAWFIVPTSTLSYSPTGSYLSGIWSWYPVTQESQVDDIGIYVARDQNLTFGVDTYQSTANGGSNGDAYQIVTTLDGYYARSADGSKHYYGDLQLQNCTQIGGGANCPTTYGGYGIGYPSADDSGYLPLNFHPLTGASSLVDANGLTYTAPAYETEVITDPAGNSITANSTGWHDTIGRNVPGSYALPGFSGIGAYQESADPTPGVPISPGQSTCPAGTSSARQWIVPSVGSGATQTYYLCYEQFSFQTAFDLPGSYENWASVYEASSTNQGSRPAVLLSNIMLPNGTSYAFSYDSYLSLSSLTLPTGATITYAWQNVYFGQSPTSPISRALQTRTINPGNGEAAQTWHYQFLPNAQYSTPSWSIVTDPNGNDVEYQLGGSDDAGNSVPPATISRQMYYAGCGPHDTASNKTCSGSGTLLKTISYVVSQYGNGGADSGTPSFNVEGYYEPTTTTTTWPASGNQNLVTKTVTTMTPLYGTCYIWADLGIVSGGQPEQPVQQGITPCYSTNQPQSGASYDYGSGGAGSLLKTVTTNYEWQSSSAYLNANLLDLPSSVVTTDGSGNKAAETDYYYDQSPSPSGAIGNLTSTVRWLNTGTSVTDSAVYNTQGMPTSTTDPNGNTTTIAYDTTGAFPKTVTHPATPSGVSHVDQYVFDSNTGLTTSHTDWNLNTTTYSYINSTTGQPDPLNRLGQVTYPATTDGTTGNSGQGYKKYTYIDTPGSLAVTEQDFQSTNGTTVTHTSEFDGLGRVFHALTTDPDGTDTVDTSYDLLGRVASVSNPYRSTSNGTTLYIYDALSRKTSQTQPDGNTLQWCYDGSPTTGQSNCHSNASSATGVWVDASDENGNDWQQVSDGLNRLEVVVEPNGTSATPSMVTHYAYDANGNLLSSNQLGNGTGSVSRSFTYDSLSRLLCASNPENSTAQCPSSASSSYTTGTVGYTYDANGNVISKMSPAPNSYSGTITTTYNYDQLNRMLSKSSNDSWKTPSACFQYDQSSQAGTTPNMNGLLANEWTQSSSTACPTTLPSSGVLTSKSIITYDTMGRVLSEQTCVYPSCTTATYPLSFTYDLAGNLTSYTNGSTSKPITLTNSYDSVGRVQSVSSSWNDATHPSPLFSAPISTSQSSWGYSPQGALANATYGTGLTLNRTYDTRLRITGETDTGSTAQSAAPGSATVTITGQEQTQ